MTKKNFKILIIVLISVMAGLASARPVSAATFYWQKDNFVGRNGQFIMTLALDTAGQNINTVSGQINYDPKLVKFVGVSDARSLLNLWIQKPSGEAASPAVALAEAGQVNSGKITFAGIAPGGFNGSGVVLDFIFLRRAEALISAKSGGGSGQLTVSNLQVLLNDGAGKLAIVKQSAKPIPNELLTVKGFGQTDNQAPSAFVPLIIQSPELSEGQVVLSFSTADKGSGVAYYAVAETKNRLNFGRPFELNQQAPWVKTASPYLLTDQNRESAVYVKAVDWRGNVRLVHLIPTPWYEKLLKWIIINIKGNF